MSNKRVPDDAALLNPGTSQCCLKYKMPDGSRWNLSWWGWYAVKGPNVKKVQR